MLKKIWIYALLIFVSSRAFSELPDFTGLIEETSPAVVKINTMQKVDARGRSAIPQGQIPEIFRDLFERRQQQPRERESYSLGSGFVISSDGYILTNHHVVDGADEIVVRFADRSEYEAELVGTDRRSDLALLKVDAKGLSTLKLADDDSLKVGEWVVAIGSPFGLDYSASVGIVSAIGRSLPTEQGENYVPFIQTDVAINPGNSGGPLFNMDGQVVGINSQIYSRSGGSIGLSFSIPASVARDVVAQIKGKGRVERGWLGVVIQDVDKALAESLELGKPRGALINAVEPDSPADKGGIEPGDVVVELDGKEILHSGDLPHVVGLIVPGEKTRAVVIRQGKRKTLTITVGSLDGDERGVAQRGDGSDRLGLVVEELSERQLQAMRLRGGVVISQVSQDSAAEAAQLVPGDVIVQLGYARIQDVNDYDAVVKELPAGTPVAIRFFRRGQAIFRTIELDR